MSYLICELISTYMLMYYTSAHGFTNQKMSSSLLAYISDYYLFLLVWFFVGLFWWLLFFVGLFFCLCFFFPRSQLGFNSLFKLRFSLKLVFSITSGIYNLRHDCLLCSNICYTFSAFIAEIGVYLQIGHYS